jgi:hypothetical protein
MGSFEENYSKAALRMFTDQEQATLRRLHQLLDEKFDEIASFLAKQHGLANADEEAEEAIERWEKGRRNGRYSPNPLRCASAPAERASFDLRRDYGHPKQGY